MKPFPWGIDSGRSTSSLRDSCTESDPLMMIQPIHSFIANHFLPDDTCDSGG